MAEAALAHDDEEAPSGFFLTEPTLPPSPEPRLRVQSIASRMQRMAQEIALLQGMGSASLLLPEQGGGAQGLAVWPLADGQLNAPDIADALEEIQRELEDAEEERKWKDILNERVALAEAIERHDGSAERERKELQEYLEGLRARVREAGISFSDEEYSRLVAAGEAAGRSQRIYDSERDQSSSNAFVDSSHALVRGMMLNAEASGNQELHNALQEVQRLDMMLVGPSENAERKSQSLACERLLNERASTIDAPDLPSSGQSVAYAKPTLSARDEERLISLMSDTHLSVLGADSPGVVFGTTPSLSQRLQEIDARLSYLASKWEVGSEIMSAHESERETALADELAYVQALPVDAPPSEEEARSLAKLLAEVRKQIQTGATPTTPRQTQF